ncbi:unnamed protein product [Ilex paraguariensis]|uniref:Uncharacterized protein n=1 Tax=Ilex paraguariensis TaxID=185542 RepID=A0ABC8SE52_9AQUA
MFERSDDERGITQVLRRRRRRFGGRSPMEKPPEKMMEGEEGVSGCAGFEENIDHLRKVEYVCSEISELKPRRRRHFNSASHSRFSFSMSAVTTGKMIQ